MRIEQELSAELFSDSYKNNIPLYTLLELTYKCNLKCKICNIGRDNKIKDKRERLKNKIADLLSWFKVHKWIKTHKKDKEKSDSEKKEVGRLINESKNAIFETITSKKNQLKVVKREWFDPTIPGKKYKIGKLHPTTQVINEMYEIFKHLGFSIIEGPEIESDVYNFECNWYVNWHRWRSFNLDQTWRTSQRRSRKNSWECFFSFYNSRINYYNFVFYFY